MWPRVYFPDRYFAPRYFPQSQGTPPPATDIDNRTGTGTAARNVTAAGRENGNMAGVGRRPNQ